MRRIDSILIGAQKAGTSSIYNWISQHPEVYAPEEMKDFHFFSLEKYNSKPEEYLHKFFKDVRSEKILLKGAVNYIYFPDVAKRLFNYNHELKLILILRNPIKRAISAYSYFYNLGLEKNSFHKALEREINMELNSREDKSNFAYISHGFYFKQIQSYLKYFPLKRIKIFIYEDFIISKEQSIKDLYKYLEIDTDFIPEFKHVNRTGEVYFRKLNTLLFSDNFLKKLLSPVTKLIPIQWKIKFGNFIRETNKKSKSSISSTLNFPDDMINIYDEDIQNLSRLLNIDLRKKWGFD